MDFEVKNRDK